MNEKTIVIVEYSYNDFHTIMKLFIMLQKLDAVKGYFMTSAKTQIWGNGSVHDVMYQLKYEVKNG